MVSTGARAEACDTTHEAVAMLQSAGMEAAYAAAWDDWAGTEDAEYWCMTSSDGLAGAPR